MPLNKHLIRHNKEIITLLSQPPTVTQPFTLSSGAGKAEHFAEVFRATDVSAALAAGMFHRQEVQISQVKTHMAAEHIPTRIV